MVRFCHHSTVNQNTRQCEHEISYLLHTMLPGNFNWWNHGFIWLQVSFLLWRLDKVLENYSNVLYMMMILIAEHNWVYSNLHNKNLMAREKSLSQRNSWSCRIDKRLLITTYTHYYLYLHCLIKHIHAKACAHACMCVSERERARERDSTHF